MGSVNITQKKKESFPSFYAKVERLEHREPYPLPVKFPQHRVVEMRTQETAFLAPTAWGGVEAEPLWPPDKPSTLQGLSRSYSSHVTAEPAAQNFKPFASYDLAGKGAHMQLRDCMQVLRLEPELPGSYLLVAEGLLWLEDLHLRNGQTLQIRSWGCFSF